MPSNASTDVSLLNSEPDPNFQPDESGTKLLEMPESQTHAKEWSSSRTSSTFAEELDLNQDGVHANAKITDDGRLNIIIDDKDHRLENLLAPVVKDAPTSPKLPLQSSTTDLPPSGLNIVIHVVGSRGDVQPFVALGRVLKSHGNRIRLATHPTFQKFVEENGLEFFSIGGDPAELMAFMVKNPGLLPGIESIRAGDIGKRQREMAQIIDGCWRSCVEGGNGMDNIPTEDKDDQPFVPDAIIANPPSFAHIHCAEKLQIPLHIMFTMPWSPTRAFPHPLANMLQMEENPPMANYLSYALVETMTWQGLGSLINRFRVKKLGLTEVDPTFAPGMVSRLKIPHTYAWSSALIPKPDDWSSHLSVSGFFFLPLGSEYTPPSDLEAFLQGGPPPVYIGFGSIVIGDPDGLTALIFEAVRKAGIRALVSKGWGGLGAKDVSIPDSIFLLGNCPHDWLFPRVSCVVHHGGAGTMAAGIASGKPTVIVPFFGDQPFWGDMIARSGAGPEPIPFKRLTAERLALAITEALKPTMTERALELAAKINSETGAETAATSFYDRLPLSDMQCSLVPGQTAVWRVPKTSIRLSSVAAAILANEQLLDYDDLRLYGPCNHITDYGSIDPVSASVKASYGIISDMVVGFTNVSRGMYKSMGPKSENSSPTSDTDIAHDELLPPPGDRQLLSRTIASSRPPAEPSLTKKGLKSLTTLPFKATMDLTSSLAQGLHNAPKLYGDDTVRLPEKITGWQSGLKAAGKELGLGVYDGFSGVVTQPLKGYREEGRVGMYKGIGKGIGGILIKPISGVSGLFGFTFKGVYKEVQKKYSRSVDGYLRAARMVQGMEMCEVLEVEERVGVVRRWEELRRGKKEKKKKQKNKEKKNGE